MTFTHEEEDSLGKGSEVGASKQDVAKIFMRLLYGYKYTLVSKNFTDVDGLDENGLSKLIDCLLGDDQVQKIQELVMRETGLLPVVDVDEIVASEDELAKTTGEYVGVLMSNLRESGSSCLEGNGFFNGWKERWINSSLEVRRGGVWAAKAVVDYKANNKVSFNPDLCLGFVRSQLQPLGVAVEDMVDAGVLPSDFVTREGFSANYSKNLLKLVINEVVERGAE